MTFPIRPSKALLSELKRIRKEYEETYGEPCSWSTASDLFVERSKGGSDKRFKML